MPSYISPSRNKQKNKIAVCKKSICEQIKCKFSSQEETWFRGELLLMALKITMLFNPKTYRSFFFCLQILFF